MTNKSKARGTRHESSIVEVLAASGWPHAERRTLNGAFDRGDIAGIIGVVIEAKATAKANIPGWLRELDVEMVNDGAATGAVWAKSVGKAHAEDGYIVMRPATWLALLKEAGY